MKTLAKYVLIAIIGGIGISAVAQHYNCCGYDSAHSSHEKLSKAGQSNLAEQKAKKYGDSHHGCSMMSSNQHMNHDSSYCQMNHQAQNKNAEPDAASPQAKQQGNYDYYSGCGHWYRWIPWHSSRCSWHNSEVRKGRRCCPWC